ncbi:MAG TPA: DUF2585 family protein [Terriglobia bacterium]|nr:DUF2585 family protein [Terriglobia bacterium]
MKRLAPGLTLGAVLLITALELRRQGRLWVCACGHVQLWSGNIFSVENSQQLFDPYTFTHLEHGLVLFGLLALVLSRVNPPWRFVIALSAECFWEIIENSATVIDRYRTETISLGYTGDTVLNSFGDILACATGVALAPVLGLKRALIVVMVMELALIVWIRDSLLLNVVMLVLPVPWIRAWQAGN